MIGAIEQGIVDRIDAVNGVGTGKLGYELTVAAFDDELSNIQKMANQFPGEYYPHAGENQPKRVGAGWVHTANFTLIIGQSNRRNSAAKRQGSHGKVGSYQILTDIRALLVGQNLGLEIDPLEPGAVKNMFNGKVKSLQASIYAHDFKTRYISQEATATIADNFETFHVDWDIPAHGNVVSPLPAAEADATDIIEPEQ